MKKFLLFLILLCPLTGFGQATIGYHRVNQILARAPQTVAAQVVPYAKVYVTVTATGSAATIYSDPLLSAQITPSVVTADLNGNYSYYIPLSYLVTETISSPGQGNLVIPNIGENIAAAIITAFASPPPIGNVAPNTGSFTTLSATAGIFTAAQIAALGNITPGTGSFTTLTASGSIAAGTTVLAPNLITNVASFGAKCDGVTDDTAAIQTAFTAAGNIQLPQGATCITSTVPVLHSNTVLDLNGGTLANPTTSANFLWNAAFVSAPLATFTDGAMTGGTGVSNGYYVSGATVTGLQGQTCTLTNFNNSSGTTGFVILTGANSLTSASGYQTLLHITTQGSSATGPSTTAALGNGSATCSGTATIVSIGTAGSANLHSASAGFTSAWVGRSVQVTGANVADPENSTLFATITAYVDATDVTLSLPAWQTVSGATVNVYPRDSNITIKNGTLSSGTGGENSSLVTAFQRVDGLTLTNLIFKTAAGLKALWVGDVTNYTLKDSYIASSVGDGFDLAGPATHVTLQNLSAFYTADDFIVAYGHAGGAGGVALTSYGPITDLLIDNVNGEVCGTQGAYCTTASQTGQTIRLESGTPQASITNATLRHVVQSNKNEGISLNSSLVGGNPSQYVGPFYGDGILIDDFKVVGPWTQNLTIGDVYGGAIGGSITIRGMQLNDNNLSNIGPIQFGGDWDSVRIEGNQFNVQGTNMSVVTLQRGSWINDLTTKANSLSIDALGATVSGVLYNDFAAYIGAWHDDGSSITNLSALGTFNFLSTPATLYTAIGSLSSSSPSFVNSSTSGGYLFNLMSPAPVTSLRVDLGYFAPSDTTTSAVLNTGALTNIGQEMFSNFDQEGGYLFLNTVFSGASIGPLRMVNAHIHGAVRFAATAVPLDLTLSGTVLDNLTNTAIASNGAAVIVRGAGLTCTGSNCTTLFTSTGGSPTFESQNPGAFASIGLSGLLCNPGDVIYNTNSGLGPLGTSYCTSGVWWGVGNIPNSTVTHQDPVSTVLTGTGSYQTMFTGTLPTLAAGRCVDVMAYWYRVSGTGANFIQWTVTDGTTPSSLATSSYTVGGTGMSKSVAHVCNRQSSTTSQLFWVDPVQTSTVLQLIGETSPAWNTSTATLTWTVAMNPIASDTYKLWYSTTGVPY